MSSPTKYAIERTTSVEKDIGCKEMVTDLKLKAIIEDKDEHQPIVTENLKNDTDPYPTTSSSTKGNNTPNNPCSIISCTNTIEIIDGIEGSIEEGDKIPEEHHNQRGHPIK